LEPALKWLSVYMRARQSAVELRVDAMNRLDIDMPRTRVQGHRELLRNVIKHSGCKRQWSRSRAPPTNCAPLSKIAVSASMAAEFIRAARARIRAVERRRIACGTPR